MHPQTRFSIALVASLALWWPTLQAALDGSVDPLDASLRWVAAFAVASIALRLLSGLIEAYAGDRDPEEDDAADADAGAADANVG